MDGRWLFLSLVVAAIAAIRWRRRAPRDEPPAGAGPAGTTPRPSPDGSTPTPTAFDAWAEARMDDRLDAQLDRPAERRAAAAGESGRGHDGHQPSRLDDVHGLDGLDGLDDADGLDGLGAALDRVWAEHAGAADTLLDARLRLIVHRGIPARAIRPAPGTRTIRVVFADGTILLCRGTGQGDFGRLGLALQQHRSVRLGSFARGVDGTRLEFRWHPDHRLAATAVGLDQPD